jgi:NAD(P)-dependent dehydrogenase (short-subunit alcohol dehydrogenase family)
MAQWQARIPMQRDGKPEEFGAMCAFLCSEGAAYITGQTLLVNGGMMYS